MRKAYFLAVLPLLLAGMGCGHSKISQEAKAPVRVVLIDAAARKLADCLLLTGELKGQEDAWIAANSTGKVVAVLVERGSIVRKGDPLVRIDDSAYRLGEKEAEANLVLAQAQFNQSKLDLERGKALLERRAITRSDFDRTETQYQVSESARDAAQARRDNALKQLQDSVVKAPFAGAILERSVQTGEFLRPDSRIIRLVSSGPLRLMLNVPESAIARIHGRQTLSFHVATFGEERFSGTVKFLPAGVREQTRDFVIEAEVPNPGGRLRPGMFASAQLQVGEVQGVVLPATALKRDGSNYKVYVAEKGLLVERFVELGEVRDGWAEIRKGVKPGEKVVRVPPPEAQDGAPFIA